MLCESSQINKPYEFVSNCGTKKLMHLFGFCYRGAWGGGMVGDPGFKIALLF